MARHRIAPKLEAGPAADVLVLCADETTRDALAYWLRSAKVATEVAADGYEANERLRSGGFRLLVTDRLLPPWPGLDNFVRLKQRLVNLRIAFVDNGMPDAHALARAAGADVILPRPLRRASVLQAAPSFDKEVPCA
jgi:DNA-binding response OmpR family regulator